MTTAKVYNQEGETTGTVELNSKIFAVPKIKPEVIHQIVTSLAANVRNVVAATKTRGEVRGGGKKPWKQKGTGRARVGSIRSPLWRGGGVTFGPRANRNFSKKIPKKLRTSGLFMALTDKIGSDQLFVMENLDTATGKTRDLVKSLQDLSVKIHKLGKKILVISGARNENLSRAARNLEAVKIVGATSLNILDILSADSVIILKNALPIIDQVYLKEK